MKEGVSQEDGFEGNIFVSYRRDDSADVVGRILDRLDVAIQDRKIFRDIDDIPLGIDFVEYVEEVIGKTSLLLVAIGPGWLGHFEARAFPSNHRTDFVRL